MPHAPSSIANLRAMFRDDKDRIPPDLARALTLLNLASLADLEERFLATTAFLIPWTVFRDSCLLVNSSRATEPSVITRLDILWFYTQYDEGLLRHDPCTTQPFSSFSIDKSTWGPSEHSKHLYAWLLQSFCVGKTHSPFRFEYFELRNICAAWEAVFIPIVRAVQASYSVRGRRHYGRLALFIEERWPSRLAFPEGNVSLPEGVITSPTPFRMVSRPSYMRGESKIVLTKRNYDEAEKELRDVYPQYGGLVERPRFRQKMEEWLEEQRVRAARRKTIAKPEVVRYVSKYQPEVVQQSGHDPLDRSLTKSPFKDTGGCSPIKRYSDSTRKSLPVNVGNARFGKSEPQSPLSPTRPKSPKVPVIPYGMYSYVPKLPKEEPKSPLHGVTRQIIIPDDVPDQAGQSLWTIDTAPQKLADESSAWPLPTPRLPRPAPPSQQPSEQSVYTSVRNSNPFSEDTPDGAMDADSDNSIWSPMGAPSAIPHPLKPSLDKSSSATPYAPFQTRHSSDIRPPSYEGSGYHSEICLSNLHARHVSSGSQSTSSEKGPHKPHSRLPAPIKAPPPYVSHTYRNDNTPKSTAVRRPNERPQPIEWPDIEDASHVVSGITPPIPAKSPERWASKRGQTSRQQPLHQHTPSQQLMREQHLQEEPGSHEIFRIVSKENIRAALGNLTPESSIEDIRAAREKEVAMRGKRPQRLEAYNTHMFPRRDES